MARVFNLTREELEARFVRPWVAGALIEHDDRRWAPDRARLTILEGARLRPDELGMGRGWATANKAGADVTDAVVAAARRGAQGRSHLDALKQALAQLTASPVSCADVVALAAAAHPGWRASDQLALAEQAVWEMLHQRRVILTASGRPVGPAQWRPILLSWATWAGAGGQRIRLRATPPT